MSPECQDSGSIGKIQLVRASPSTRSAGHIAFSFFLLFLVLFSVSRVERLQKNEFQLFEFPAGKKSHYCLTLKSSSTFYPSLKQPTRYLATYQ